VQSLLVIPRLLDGLDLVPQVPSQILQETAPSLSSSSSSSSEEEEISKQFISLPDMLLTLKERLANGEECGKIQHEQGTSPMIAFLKMPTGSFRMFCAKK
jgi:hypothetical protein